MMSHTEADAPMQLARSEVGENLPEVIIRVQSAAPSLPEGRPAWQIDIIEMDIRSVFPGHFCFNRRTVLAPRQDPYFGELRNVLHPVPAYARLGALAGFASIG